MSETDGFDEPRIDENTDWPGYLVYWHEIEEAGRVLRLWMRRKGGNRVLICSGCGGRAPKIEEVREREVRDLLTARKATYAVETRTKAKR